MSVLLSALESCSALWQNICDARVYCSINVSNLTLYRPSAETVI